MWQNDSSFLIRITVAGDGDFSPLNSPSSDSHKKSADLEDKTPLYILIRENDDKTQQKILRFLVHSRESASRTNFKKAVAFLTRPRPNPTDHLVKFQASENGFTKSFKWANSGSGASSILNPDIKNIWNQEAKLDPHHPILISSSGWQNVTLRSRVYTEALSHMSLEYSIELQNTKIREEQLTDLQKRMSDCKNGEQAVSLLGDDFIEEEPAASSSSLILHLERKVCHDCRSFESMANEYEDFLSGKEAASMKTVIAYLKIVNGLRHEGEGTARSDIVSVLRKYEKSGNSDVVQSLLDALAAARTENSISAALEFLDLQNNNDLDVTERFLSVLPASFVTAANSLPYGWTPGQDVRGQRSFDFTSHTFVMEELMRILNREGKWKSEKIRWSTLLTLASISKSHDKLMHKHSVKNEKKLGLKVIKMIVKELEGCDDDTECSIAMLLALGNTGDLTNTVEILEKYALDSKRKRESVAAMKSLKECLEQQHSLTGEQLKVLRNLALRIVYNSKHETTSRIIATEIIVKHLSDPVSSERLLQFISDFGKSFGSNQEFSFNFRYLNRQQ